MSPHIKGEAETTLLLPVYNEVESLEAVISEFYGEISKKVPVKIVVVEDGSIDGTKELLIKLSEKIPMTLILGDERRGYSNAMIEGLKKVDTEFVFFTDSDGQHLAKDFWTLYEIRERYDVVSGWRVERADAFHRKIMSTIFQQLAKILFGLPSLRDITAPYRLMRSRVAKCIANEIKFMKESFWTELTIRAHERRAKIVEVPVTHRSRIEGPTRVYKPLALPRIALSQFVGLLKLWLELKNRRQALM